MLHWEDALPHQQKLSMSISHHILGSDLTSWCHLSGMKDTGQAEEHDRSDQSREPNSDAALLDGLNPVLPV